MKKEAAQLKSFLVIGLHIQTSYESELNPSLSKIAPVWEKFITQKISGTIPNRSDNKKVYACYTNYENKYKSKYSFILGHEVTSLDIIPEGMKGVEVPAQKYQLFSFEGPMPKALIEEWLHIWKLYDDMKTDPRSYGVDFEQYDLTKEKQGDIYIGINE